MRVIGTAGHVDHGKSTLVKRLTGIDPDRLAEEKARQMTIDLGFAWFDLPQAGRVGVVDVPGHRDFIENMLAGIVGIDLALLIIAADEGVMPQTREHLAILDLLQIDRALVVLTKIDLIDDADWLTLIEAEVQTALAGTRLAAAPLIGVSAHSGAGIAALRDALDTALSDLPPRSAGGLLRLPVDRVFTLSGFGTVVTGTLRGDVLHTGDDVTLLPNGLTARVRGLHSYDQAVTAAQPGSRTAVNLAGIDKTAVRRGDLLVRPGSLTPTLLIDVQYRHLPDADAALKHNTPVKLFCGTAEITGTVRVLDGDAVEPGTTAWLQIALDRPLAATEGDSFILRRPSPPQTLGGGQIVRLHPARKWKRNDPAVLEGFARLSEQQAATARVAAAVDSDEPRSVSAMQTASQLRGDAFTAALTDALALGLIIALERPGGVAYWNADRAARLRERLRREVGAYHAAQPLRIGIPREELRSRLKLKADALAALIETDPALAVSGAAVRLADHEITFSGEQAAQVAALRSMLEAAPFTPPSYADAVSSASAEIVHALIDLGAIVRVSDDVIFSRTAYDALVSGVQERLAAEGTITVGTVRDLFQTSRKYALALLEHLDTLGLTKRQGDQRVRGSR